MTEPTQPPTGEPSTNGNGSHARETPESMFDSLRVAANDLAERAGPTVRELSARAAELTATAAVKAGPLARRAGEAAADVSSKLAVSARGWAAELRGEKDAPMTAESTGMGSATAVAEPPAREEVSPSDVAADEPPVGTGTAPFESTAESEMPSPAFDEGAAPDAGAGAGGTDEDGTTRPGI